MIITTRSGRSFDTDSDLTAVERHVLQKLMIWETMASGIDEFRERKEKALRLGWNESGPIQESEALRTIVTDMEERIRLRESSSSK